MNKILFLIPHPDDEIVGACKIIKNFQNKKKKFLFYFSLMVLSIKTQCGHGIEKNMIRV